ncbi:cholesteryl ester transfer protein [Gymnodraco acuticeps]|uniref:Cholesteryl ester transfer protein n=1 Tax=Gymnodraco acuticeps TaxID=8218 RepID=A0A6P8VB71_GYMAC|nr:cholesteryl ester transfer protein [Gymnodraco acuticeps]
MSLDVVHSLLLFLFVFGASHACLQDPAEAYRFTGAVSRLTYPAVVVLNEKTTKVIEAAFQHARYPSVKGETSLFLIGTLIYGLENLEIHNLSIGQSTFELHPGEGISMEITNVSAVFKGRIQYGYGSWLVSVEHSIDFEIESQIDLGINPKLYCGEGKVAADTSDCFLNFHKLSLHLQGDKEPNWLKKLFTDFIIFTVKLVVKGQICKEINKVANILADFIQERAEQFLSDGDISVDIGVAAAPVITANYIESYHKGLSIYKNVSAVINESVFHPSQLTEHKMLYFWISDQILNPMFTAAHHDARFQLNISGAELSELFKTNLSSIMPEYFRKCLLESGSPQLRVWSSSVPYLHTSTLGTNVRGTASAQLHCGGAGAPTLSFQAEVDMDITVSYADKKVFLQNNRSEIYVLQAEFSSQNQPHLDQAQLDFIREAVEKIGIPKVLSVFETEVTRLLDEQGTYLFDIFSPEVLPQEGFTVIQMDFGFPHHLLVEFLRRTLQ